MHEATSGKRSAYALSESQAKGMLQRNTVEAERQHSSTR